MVGCGAGVGWGLKLRDQYPDSLNPAFSTAIGPGPIDEDQACRVNPTLIPPPLHPTSRDVRPLLLAGVQGFF